MTEPIDNEKPADTPHLRPKSGGRDGLLFGMAIGFAVWLPFMLFSGRFLARAVGSLFAAVVIGLLVCAVGGTVLYVFRRCIARRFLGDVNGSSRAAVDAIAAAVFSWPDKQQSAQEAARAAQEVVAVGAWMVARRTAFTVLLGMVGSVVAMTGTMLLLKQTEALEEQNRKLDAQTVLLERQNIIMASEGRWELLWQSHYGVDPTTRLEAAVELGRQGMMLSGLNFDSRVPASVHVNSLYEAVQLLELNAAFMQAPHFPASLFSKISNTSMAGFRVGLDRIPNSDVSSLEFRECEVSVHAVPFVVECAFRGCLLRPQGEGVTFRSCKLQRCLIGGTPMGRGWMFQSCDIDHLAIDSTGSRDLNGAVLDPDVPIAQAMGRYALFFQSCSVGTVYIRGQSLVGFRDCEIKQLQLEMQFEAHEIGIVLRELIAANCSIGNIAVGSVQKPIEPGGNSWFKVDETATAIATAWVKANTD